MRRKTFHNRLNTRALITAFLSLVLSLTAASSAFAETTGSQEFTARPKIGAARLSLPARVTWQATSAANGIHLVALTLTIDATSVLRDIRALSAAALNKSKPCGDLIKVRDASAKLIGTRKIAYNLSFHYAKLICINGGKPLELPAEIACSSVIVLSGSGTQLTVDIRGATKEPCSIDGASSGLATFASKKVFKRHVLDLTQQLPPEFEDVTVNLRTIAFDAPPASPRLRITGEATMTDKQFAAFTARATAAASRAQRR